MNEKLLRALMELFAIAANIEVLTSEGREIVKSFLKEQVTLDIVNQYLELFDHFVEKHGSFSKSSEKAKAKAKERMGLPVRDSTKALVISEQINTELTQKQKIVVLIRVLEFMFADGKISPVQDDFISTVASAFNTDESEFNIIKAYILHNDVQPSTAPHALMIDKESDFSGEAKHIQSSHLEGQLSFLRIASVDTYLVKYLGDDELYLNGVSVRSGLIYLFANGSSIRNPRISPIYYSDVVSQFLSELTESSINFVAKDIKFQFPNGKIGLRNINIAEESGKLLGFMGASGAGKTTLMNVLSGLETPTEGAALINGINIHKDKKAIEGVIGYVAQDDLLIEELTVYQNLYYNAKLCFGNLGEEDIDKLVMKTLTNLGLAETRDIIVGSPLNKKISGGQRKRLNIGLELIREPSVMFVDEPTSGLSSRDSENIMDLLKELSLKGKLIFVVIHQPSSDIFKMFDKLYILDTGGYPAYYGNPSEAVIYFKKMTNHVNADKAECAECGNINPEQIFNIIESKVIDEYGNFTEKRKISPQQWHEFYKENVKVPKVQDINEKPHSTLVLPNPLKQLKVFVTRDVLSKLSNTQYMVINFTEAPLLAFILSYLVRYFTIDDSTGLKDYVFSKNENVMVYVFMSVIVALFMGLTVSAEEIIKDQKIRKRETFLNLSKQSYLFSKVLILLAVSSIQMFTYVLIGNYILEIKDMGIQYWLALFSTAFFANMLGLNVSATFNSAVTIYILIPILLIPQLLLSGAVVKFDKLNPKLSSQVHVPLTGDMMASKWAFEALMVNQFKNNKYERSLYKYDKLMSIAEYKKNYLVPKLIAKNDFCDNNYQDQSVEQQQNLSKELGILRNYISIELEKQSIVRFDLLDQLKPEVYNSKVAENTKEFLKDLKTYYIKTYNYANNEKDKVVSKMQDTPEKREAFLAMKDAYYNENISTLVKNNNSENRIIETEGLLVQKIDPIFMDPNNANSPIDFRAHMFAPRKYFMGNLYGTFGFNMIIIWMMSLTLYITLSFDGFKRFLAMFSLLFEQIASLFKKKKAH